MSPDKIPLDEREGLYPSSNLQDDDYLPKRTPPTPAGTRIHPRPTLKGGTMDEDEGPLVEVLEMHIVYRVPVYAANVGEALDRLREDGYAFLKGPTRVRKMHERSLSAENDRQRR
jgi:hypothetical protein